MENPAERHLVRESLLESYGNVRVDNMTLKGARFTDQHPKKAGIQWDVYGSVWSWVWETEWFPRPSLDSL